MDKICFSESD
jgi:hypothetical protein